ncbi:MAG TPA: hypothetical protein VIG90_17230 [Pedomonas sp.]|uniref:hypothetical protein n=1 Tax=Pedomonas sp. TaxID=2976421 RepID=UPI002F414A46
MFAIRNLEPGAHDPLLSSKRQRLTDYNRADRLARQIHDKDQKPVVILYVGSPLQQYRLVVGEDIQKLVPGSEEFEVSRVVTSYV